MRRLFIRKIRPARRGFTLIELLVVISIIATLMSLVLPAVQSARQAARRLQCMNNMKNLGLAATNFASSRGGLPLLSEPAPGLASSTGNTLWAMQLLPFMDQAGAIEYITQQSTTAAANAAVTTVLSASYSILQCPDDSNHFRHSGGLSYGANMGYGGWTCTTAGVSASYDFGSDHTAQALDWNSNKQSDDRDKQVARSTGVFWAPDADGFRMSLDSITSGDGTGSTILFAESLNLPQMHAAGSGGNGFNPTALQSGVGLGLNAIRLFTSKSSTLYMDAAQTPTVQYPFESQIQTVGRRSESG